MGCFLGLPLVPSEHAVLGALGAFDGAWDHEVARAAAKRQQPSLARALFGAFGWRTQ